MMQVINKWRIVFDTNGFKFYINENHLANVLLQIAKMSFDGEPTRITIDLVSPSGLNSLGQEPGSIRPK